MGAPLPEQVSRSYLSRVAEPQTPDQVLLVSRRQPFAEDSGLGPRSAEANEPDALEFAGPEFGEARAAEAPWPHGSDTVRAGGSIPETRWARSSAPLAGESAFETAPAIELGPARDDGPTPARSAADPSPPIRADEIVPFSRDFPSRVIESVEAELDVSAMSAGIGAISQTESETRSVRQVDEMSSDLRIPPKPGGRSSIPAFEKQNDSIPQTWTESGSRGERHAGLQVGEEIDGSAGSAAAPDTPRPERNSSDTHQPEFISADAPHRLPHIRPDEDDQDAASQTEPRSMSANVPPLIQASSVASRIHIGVVEVRVSAPAPVAAAPAPQRVPAAVPAPPSPGPLARPLAMRYGLIQS